MTQCVNHPQYPAVEHCEQCQVPVCGLCLWYAQSGQRLCERCAKAWQEAGHTVYPPETFAKGIPATLDAPAAKSAKPGLHSGNNTDLLALFSACLGGTVLLSIIPCLNILFLLVAIALGIIALIDAERSVVPARTRLLAIIGLVGAGIIILLTAMWIVFMFGFPLLMTFFVTMGGQGP